jgi:hypothetical protein
MNAGQELPHPFPNWRPGLPTVGKQARHRNRLIAFRLFRVFIRAEQVVQGP